ncbi:MAG: lasso peptide biosynthesis B2 protein [Thermoanaerobaculia bacterium]
MRPLRPRVSRFLALPPEDRRVIIHAAGLIPWMAARLRLTGLQRLRANHIDIAATSPSNLDPSATKDRALHIALLVAIAARNGPYRGSCLSQSLALLYLLQREGIDADLRLGVRKEASLEAHAWVEYEGRPLNDTPDVATRYAPYPAL